MANYSKPGVYIEESLLANAPINTQPTQSIAAFVGYSDHGPTAPATIGSTAYQGVGVPTLVTGWGDFVNKFAFGNASNVFSSVKPTYVTTSSSISTSATSISVATAGITVGSVVSFVAGTAGSFADRTLVTAVGAGTITISASPTVAVASGSTLAITPNTDLKYALKSFFDNGGSQAYVLRDGAATASAASLTIRDQGISTVTWSNSSITLSTGTNSLTFTSSNATDFANFAPGQVLTISGITGTDTLKTLNNQWIVTAAASGSGTSSATIFYTGTTQSGIALTTGSIVSGYNNSTTNALNISANGAGTWGNNIWITILPSSTANYFDLNVYISSASDAATALKTDIVERWPQLSMDATNSRYFANLINSAYITVTDGGSPNTGYNRLPVFNGSWSSALVNSANPANTTATGSFVWSIAASGFTATGAVDLGVTASSQQIASSPAAVTGTEGSTARSAITGLTDVMVGRFDSASAPLVMNWAGNSSSDVTNLLSYAANRGDSFVVIDAPNTTVASTLAVVNGFTTNQKFGAAYYPYITIPQPYTSSGQIATIPPGGAVVGTYVKTDSTRGVFKAPAGAKDANLANVVSIASLSSADFDVINNNSGANLNVIRYVPGNGICIMGARTLATDYTNRYVPVRRTLNYLASNFKSITQFAVFEPNDTNLWVRVSTVVNTFLNDFWRTGGLYGATADQAFYVKCDNTINTTTSVSAGELHVEIGVALLKPAEFIVIRIGQVDSGTTVTVTV